MKQNDDVIVICNIYLLIRLSTIIDYENHDIAIAMSSSRADPVTDLHTHGHSLL